MGTPSESGQTGREGEIEIDHCPGKGADGAGLLHFASFMMSGCQNIGPPRESGRECVISVLVGNSEEGMGKNAHVSKHPGVHIAVNADEQFRISEPLLRNHAFDRHGQIEFRISGGGGANVVHRRIGIADSNVCPA